VEDMKQVLTYISPEEKFNEEHEQLVKIQIDNSLSLGWSAEDILLVTNFDYKYKGVESIITCGDLYCEHHWPATKIYAINDLFEMRSIINDLYWYHDFDCFQLVPFTDTDPQMGECDMGLSDYGRMLRLCSASIFFRNSSDDIFARLREYIDKNKIGEEEGIMRIINDDKILQKRVKKINISYAFHKFNLNSCYRKATKPIRAAHFHATPDKYDFFVNGNNRLKMKIIPDRLVKIFNDHGFK
jgi:hypothetical protein